MPRTHREAWTALAAGDHGWLTEPLQACPHRGVFWECTPTSRAALDAPFDHHLTPTRFPEVTDGQPFADSFRAPGPDVRAFPSLGRDARLVVPAPAADTDPTHLLAFLRTAAPDHVERLWVRVGQEVLAWTDRSERPVWVSTHGHGVYWLHVRLDSRPKYYTHRPFCAPPG